VNETVRTLVEDYWDRLVDTNPVLGTMAGDERADDRLPDLTEPGRDRARAWNAEALARAEAIDRDALEVEDRLELDVLEAIARRELAELDQRMDRLFVASHMFGPPQLIGDLAAITRLDTPERLDRYEARLRAFPSYLEGAADVLRDGVAAGVTSPRIVLERSIGQTERLLEAGVDGSPALAPIDDAPTRERFAAVIDAAVLPAYAAFLDALRTTLPHATDTLGLAALPDGDALYGSQILAYTSLPLDAEEVHAFGQERFASIQQERFEVAARLGHDDPAAAVAARTASGENTAASPEAFLALAEERVRRSWEAAPRWFSLLPEANCEVKPVEAFRAEDMPAAYYHPPTEDGSRPGVYFVNTSDLPSRPLHQVAGIAYHEANPGHHFQVALEVATPGRSMMRRFAGIAAGGAFVEGWGLYSERLADEMGLYEDDWERLGMLENQALRAARLITDTGIHAFGWDRQRAIDVLVDGGSSPNEAAIEVDRYVAVPAQALCYMVGMREIERAREAAGATEPRTLRDFHDRVLSLGTLPLPALRRELGTQG
jgi:uncharacterized protein (DUF885 family)